jgi:pimeloyl-ACP methyl ester carboxylesterase
LHAAEGTDCIGIDLPGHGTSGGGGRQSVDAYADFVESLVATLQLDALTLIGHSMGGAIVQTLALRHMPWLRRIVLVGTGAKLRVAKDLLDLLDADYPEAVALICSRAFGPSVSGSMRERYRQGLLQTSPEVTRDDYLACNTFDLMDKVGAIDIPTLIVSGAADELTPPKYGNYLQRRIKGASHTIIPEAGHMMALEKPAEFTEALSAFIA